MGRKTSGIGLNFGSNSIRLVRLKKHPRGYRLEEYAGAAIPENAWENGMIYDVEGLAMAIDEAFDKAGIKNRKVVTTVPGQLAYVRNLTLPIMKRRELKRAVYYQAAAFLPVTPEEMVMDFFPYRRSSGKKEIEVMLVAVRRQVIEAMVELFRQAKVVPEVVEIEPVSLYRAFCSQDDLKGFLVVDIGASSTQFSFFEEGKLKFVRSVALAQKWFELNKQREDRLIALPRPALEFFREVGREITRTIEYYELHHNWPESARIVLTGGGAALAGLAEFLQESLSYPVVVGDAFSRVEWPCCGSEDERQLMQYTFTVAIGSAMREVVR